MSYYKGSFRTADVFLEEALKRKKEIDLKRVKVYLINILKKLENLKSLDKQELAENALMYSTIIQNATRRLK